MKLFHLERTEDASGISGIGKVAEGVVFEDGTVGLRWLTEVKSTVFFESIKDVESVHGHEGKTKIVFEGTTDVPTARAEVRCPVCHPRKVA